jgi:hypothetical protein
VPRRTNSAHLHRPRRAISVQTGRSASLEAAVTPDHVQCDGSPAVDNDQWSGIELERAECIDQTARSDLGGLAGPHLDAELGILADDQRLDMQVTTRQVSQVEDGLRHDTRYHAGLQKVEFKLLHRHQLRQPHGVFIGCTAGLGRRAPLGDPMIAVVNREQAVGVSLLNCQKHRSSPALQLHTLARRRPIRP